MASAQANHSPMVVLGGRAPAMRWGQGSLQEIDHVPFVRPLTKLAATPESTEEIPGLVDDAFAAALDAARRAGVRGLPAGLRVHGGARARPDALDGAPPRASRRRRRRAIERAAELLRAAERPVIMAGTDLYWGRGEERAAGSWREALRIPVFLNGLARGCVPADHELFFSRARSQALKGADVALVIGVPMDFRLGFGAALRRGHRDRRDRRRRARAPPSAAGRGRVLRRARPARSRDLRAAARRRSALHERSAGSRSCARPRPSGARPSGPSCEDDRAPLHPMRLYAELGAVLDRDAIVIGDGGDFVSYAGRVVDSYQPGCWLDPGPFGCLGTGPGYALAAKLAQPERQVVLLLGDGAFGFSGMEFDTLARHGVNVVGVMGNNGIWALEKHPMEFLYGYSVAAELRPARAMTRWSQALGCHGELVERPRGPARPRSSARSPRASRRS